MLTLLVYFVFICVVMYGIKSIVPMPPPMDKVFNFACILVALIFLVYALQVAGIMHIGHLPQLQ